MEYHLCAPRQAAAQKVGVRIASEQEDLKKQHASGPNRRCSSEPRQNVFAKQQLDPEQEEGAEQYRSSKQRFSGLEFYVHDGHLA